MTSMAQHHVIENDRRLAPCGRHTEASMLRIPHCPSIRPTAGEVLPSRRWLDLDIATLLARIQNYAALDYGDMVVRPHYWP